MPLPIMLAHRITRRLSQLRRSGKLAYLRPDGKSQVTVEYDDHKTPVRIDTAGTSRVPEAEIEKAVSRLFDLSPLGIIKELNLRRPLFRPTAVYGHFGRTDIDAPWESTRRAAELAEELSLKA